MNYSISLRTVDLVVQDFEIHDSKFTVNENPLESQHSPERNDSNKVMALL